MEDRGNGKNEVSPLSREHIREVLEKSSKDISLFHHLEHDEVLELVPYFSITRIPEGTRISDRKDFFDIVGVIVSGKLEAKMKTNLPGKYISIAILSDGALLGDFSETNDRAGDLVRVKALEETEVLFATRKRFEELLDGHPRAGVKILKAIAGVLTVRIRYAMEKISLLS